MLYPPGLKRGGGREKKEVPKTICEDRLRERSLACGDEPGRGQSVKTEKTTRFVPPSKNGWQEKESSSRSSKPALAKLLGRGPESNRSRKVNIPMNKRGNSPRIRGCCRRCKNPKDKNFIGRLNILYHTYPKITTRKKIPRKPGGKGQSVGVFNRFIGLFGKGQEEKHGRQNEICGGKLVGNLAIERLVE